MGALQLFRTNRTSPFPSQIFRASANYPSTITFYCTQYSANLRLYTLALGSLASSGLLPASIVLRWTMAGVPGINLETSHNPPPPPVFFRWYRFQSGDSSRPPGQAPPNSSLSQRSLARSRRRTRRTSFISSFSVWRRSPLGWLLLLMMVMMMAAAASENKVISIGSCTHSSWSVDGHVMEGKIGRQICFIALSLSLVCYNIDAGLDKSSCEFGSAQLELGLYVCVLIWLGWVRSESLANGKVDWELV